MLPKSSPTPSRTPSFQNLANLFQSSSSSPLPPSRIEEKRRAKGGPGMRNKPVLIWGMRFGWVVLVIWCEVGEYFSSISTCHFPDSLLLPPPSSSSTSSHRSWSPPTHVLLLSDPQIPHPTLSYPYLSPMAQRWRVFLGDLYMRKSWNVVMRLGRIDAVIVAGDMMDWGRGVFDDKEYQAYLGRFRSIFRLPPSIPMHFVPGNQDVGLGPHRLFSPRSKERYAANFSPPNALLPIANHTFILLDSVSLVEEDYRRYAAEVQLGEWEGVRGGVIEFVKALGDDPPPAPRILITHIPLARPELASCGSLREKGRLVKGAGIGYQNLLGSETTRFLLHNIKPSVVFSGDDHDYCEYWHPNGVREVTLKSFSSAAEIRRPGFQLLSLVPPTYNPNSFEFDLHPQRTHADVPCLLPDVSEIYIRHYLPAMTLSVLLLFWLNLKWYGGSLGSSSHHLSPQPSPSMNGHAQLGSRKEKPLPLIIPSRKSSQNLLSATPTPTDRSYHLSRSTSMTPTLATPTRRPIRSAPTSPSVSPRQDPISDYDLENGHDAVYMTSSGIAKSRTLSSNAYTLDSTDGRSSDWAEEPNSYFLPLPYSMNGMSSPNPAGPSSGSTTPTAHSNGMRPLTARRVSRPSDWVSAAKAKDTTVLELLSVDVAKRWVGRDGLRRLFGGRQGVVVRAGRDLWRVLWMPVVVWWVLNLMYFV